MRRPERVAELVREEVAQIVQYELSDPRVLGVTVTDVRIADNLRDARVYVTVEGTEQETRAAIEALRNAAPYVRHQLSVALDMRHAPLLHFVRDTVEEQANRVNELLNSIKREKSEAESDEKPETMLQATQLTSKGETP